MGFKGSATFAPRASLDIQSLDIQSLDIQSLDIRSLDIQSLDIQSLDIQSLDIRKSARVVQHWVRPGSGLIFSTFHK